MQNNFYFIGNFSNIYKHASKRSEVTSQIIHGEKFKILAKSKNWIKIKTLFDNYKGFIKNLELELAVGLHLDPNYLYLNKIRIT